MHPIGWDDRASRYEIVESTALPEEVTDLDEYVFVVRTRTGKLTKASAFQC